MFPRRHVASIFTALCLVLTPVFAFAETSPRAKVLAVHGKVEIQEKGSTAWAPLTGGAIVNEGSRILAGKDGNCTIGFLIDQKSAVEVRPDTQLTVESLSPVKVSLQNGKLLSLVRDLKPGSSFALQTPTAVASARGTGAVTEVGPEGDTRMDVTDGTWTVEGAGGESYEVSEGSAFTFTEDEGFAEAELNPETVKEWESFEDTAAAVLEPPPASSETEKKEGSDAFSDDLGVTDNPAAEMAEEISDRAEEKDDSSADSNADEKAKDDRYDGRGGGGGGTYVSGG